MMVIILCLFYFSVCIIVWAMIGYPISLKILDKIFKNRELKKNYEHIPTVTVMVVAHNEEKVILQKLSNILSLDYPKDKIEYLIASDNSNDNTNEIVKMFISENQKVNIKLFEVKERKGKTNAQNEAQKIVNTEFLVMTDANSIMKSDAVTELMAAFTSADIAYVSGKLMIINQNISGVSHAEASYWDSDLKLREIEGRLQTITAGNGALYACRNDDYHDFDPIFCHDSSMPPYYALQGRRSIANHDAVAYEKAGEVIEDEFKRKVRMNRVILHNILPDLRILNVFKYKWFSYFYFGHRTCRYLLWIAHLTLFLTNIALLNVSIVYKLLLFGQSMFYLLAQMKVWFIINNKVVTMIYYYTVTIFAQWIGVINIITKKSKPFWEKAESTR